MPAIPVQLDQLLTLALSVTLVTQALKSVATSIGGSGAVAVSAVVAGVLTVLGYAVGWIPFAAPGCSLTGDPFGCAGEWVTTAGAAMALANALYVVVYSRVFGSGGEPA